MDIHRLVAGMVRTFEAPLFVVKETITGGLSTKVPPKARIIGYCERHEDAVALMHVSMNRYLQEHHGLDVLSFRKFKPTASVTPRRLLMSYLCGRNAALCLPWEDDESAAFNKDGTVRVTVAPSFGGEDEGDDIEERWYNDSNSRAVFEIMLEKPGEAGGAAAAAAGGV